MKKNISRRTFLFGTAGLIASSTLYANTNRFSALPVRKRIPNPYMENGKPIVVVVKGKDFAPMLAKGMEILGGFSRLGTEHPVHLKPNFVATSRYPTTTDGASLITTVEMLKKEGFTDITISECASMTSRKTGAFELYGLDKKSVNNGFKILDLYSDTTVRVESEKWKTLPSVNLFQSIYKAPIIINMPTLKQHSQAGFSCGLKNAMGLINNETRMNAHSLGLNSAIAEIASAVDPELTIVDARSCLGRNHHLSLGGVLCYSNRLIISGDVIAADRVAAAVLAESYDDFDERWAHEQIGPAVKLGLGVSSIDEAVIKEATI